MNIISDIKKILSGCHGKKIRNCLVVLACGICMLIIVWPDTGNDEQEDRDARYGDDTEKSENSEENEFMKQETEISDYYNSAAEYSTFLENRLEEVLSEVSGVGRVTVMITLQKSGEIVVEKDKTASGSTDNQTDSEGSDISGDTETSETTVMQDTANGSIPYITSVISPGIEGVVVSCEGGGNPDTALKITEAVQALFDIPAHKIVVLELK